jgi:hypothetical protein
VSKRFTDIKKWRDPWFRSLSNEQKLAWIFLNDECDHSGVWVADYALASFQLNFTMNEGLLRKWFGDRLYFFDQSVLILGFFEQQYGTSRDSWSAKASAKARLESLGFSVVQNKVIVEHSGLPSPLTITTPIPLLSRVGGQSPHSGGRVVDNDKCSELFDQIYQVHPRSGVKSRDYEAFLSQNLNQGDAQLMLKAAINYRDAVKAGLVDYPLFFKHWLDKWQQWLDPASNGLIHNSGRNLTPEEEYGF